MITIMISPSDKISKKIVLQLIQISKEKLNSLSKEVHNFSTKQRISKSIYFHISHSLERISDIELIVNRYFSQIKSLQIYDRKILTFKNGEIITQDKLHVYYKKTHRLIDRLKLDFESLYLFGGILLDQFSIITSHIGQFNEPENFTFANLIKRLKVDKNSGILNTFWEKQKGDISWLNAQLKFYRNKFIVHVDREWQRSQVYDLYAYNFRLFSPASPSRGPTQSIKNEIYDLSSKLLNTPREQLLKTQPRKLLEKLIHRIKEFDDIEDHKDIYRLTLETGLATPSFQYLVVRLFSFIISGSDSLKLIIFNKSDFNA